LQKLKKLIIASNNSAKVKEIKTLLANCAEQILSLSEAGVQAEIEEIGLTFEENAIIKAKAVYALTGVPAIADDSGLEVSALQGAPGIYSARFAGEPTCDKRNNDLLISRLKGQKDRAARFVCVLALYMGEGNLICATGECKGKILHSVKGQNGFGYDPLFFSLELQKTFGQAQPNEKNMVSHRARALTKLAEILSQKE